MFRIKILSKIFLIVFVLLHLAHSIPEPQAIGKSTDNEIPFDPNQVIEKVSISRKGADYPIRVDNNLTGEFLLDTNVYYVASGQAQSYPAIASNGTNFLVVWVDHRSSFNDDIYGAMVSAQGMLFDSAGILISVAPNNQQSPAIAFDGNNFFCVWCDSRNGWYDIYGTRISQSGEVLDPWGIPISIQADMQQYPSLAFDGTNYLVVWQDTRGGSTYDIYGTRVSTSGTVLEPSGILISAADDNQQNPEVGFDQNNWLIVWQDRRYGSDYDIFGTRVSSSGSILDTNGITIFQGTGDQRYPAVSSGDTISLVVWDDLSSGYYSDIYGARINQSGIVLDPSGIAISTANQSQGWSSVEFDGTNFLVTWNDLRSGQYYDIYGARVTETGQVLEPSGIAISIVDEIQSSPAVAFGDTNFFVVWSDSRGGNSWAIYGARVTQDGSVLDPDGIITSTVPNVQYNPAVSFDGLNYFVVWGDYRTGTNRDIYGARVTPTGIVLDPIGIAICTVSTWQGEPAIGFDGTNYLVAWSDLRRNDFDIYGTRVTPAGEVLEPAGIPISIAAQIQLYPEIAYDGTNWLVLWHDWRNHQYDIYGARVASSGMVLDPNAIAICISSGNQYHPAVASDGNKSLVVWDDTRGGSSRIYGTRVTQDGSVLEPNGILISNSSSYIPSIAFADSNYLVTWDDYRVGSANIYGTRVSTTGSVLDPSGISIGNAANAQNTSDVGFDGEDWFVAWQDYQSGADYDIYCARVSQAGSVLETFEVSNGLVDQISPAIAHGPENQMFITWSGWIDSICHRPANTHRIWGKFYPGVGIEEDILFNAKRLTPEIYPNPAKTVIRVRYPWSDKGSRLIQAIKIFDVSGKLIREITSPPKADRNDRIGEIKISLKGINPGLYFLVLGKETTKLMVVK